MKCQFGHEGCTQPWHAPFTQDDGEVTGTAPRKWVGTVKKVLFVAEDITASMEVYVLVQAEAGTGEPPENMNGWHHDSFPKTVGIAEILPILEASYLEWPILNPPPL